jgi:hypothetical protein
MWTAMGYLAIGLIFAEGGDWASKRARLKDLNYREAYVMTMLIWPIILLGVLFGVGKR